MAAIRRLVPILSSSTMAPLSRIRQMRLVTSGSSHTGLPPTRTVPVWTGRSAATSAASVVLPAPLRPTSPVMVPGRTAQVTSASATVEPKRYESPAMSTPSGAVAPEVVDAVVISPP